MKRPRAVILVALALTLAACGGGEDRETTTSPAPAETPSGGAASGLPPAFVQCMADQGIDLESSPELIHSPEGDKCFNSLHQGGGGIP
jgi:hypothetical protein